MDLMEAIRNRHSVRAYTEKPIEEETVKQLQAAVDDCNREGGLHIQMVSNEPQAFKGVMAHYGGFSGVTSYFALIGGKSPDLEERCGYYGEKLVLLSQQLGLNTCWVALTYSKVKDAYTIADGEKLTAVITVGYGANQGKPHKSKMPSQVVNSAGPQPEWFQRGVEAALLAPTAINQQKFRFNLNGDKVSLKAGIGPYVKLDLGIVKYHFEIGAGRENFSWV